MAFQRYTAQKYFRNFRLHVTPGDRIGLEITLDREIKQELELVNLSLSGLAFVTDETLELNEEVSCKISLKKKQFEFTGQIVRVAKYPQKAGHVLYGVKFFRVSDENARQFIETLVAYFSSGRLKKELINLLSNEIQLEVPTLNDFLALMDGLYSDLRRFERNQGLLLVLLAQFRRYLRADDVHLIKLSEENSEQINGILPSLIQGGEMSQSITGTLLEKVIDRRSILTFKHSSLVNDQHFKNYGEGQDTEAHHCMVAPVFNQNGEIIGLLDGVRYNAEDGAFTDIERQLMHFFAFSVSNLFLDCLFDTGTDTILLENPTNPRKYSFIGESLKSREVRHFIASTKQFARPVLVCGGEGNGKELLSRIIHTEGSRSQMPYGVLDCRDLLGAEFDFESYLLGGENAIGKFELYSGGTMIVKSFEYLDLSQLNTLARLLKIKTDVRVILTTSMSLNEALEYIPHGLQTYFEEAGGLQAFEMAPLTQRLEDIPQLVRCFVRKTCDEMGLVHKKISSRLIERFMHYAWPQNVRELKLAVERMVLLNKGVGLINDLPPEVAMIFDPYYRQKKAFSRFISQLKLQVEGEQELIDVLQEALLLLAEAEQEGRKRVA
jgi:transcriptional regulator with GAF, ATPase, and Fis domain